MYYPPGARLSWGSFTSLFLKMVRLKKVLQSGDIDSCLIKIIRILNFLFTCCY